MSKVLLVCAIFLLLGIQDIKAKDFMGPMETNIDRMGSDINNFDLAAADPKLCQGKCAGDPACLAWTYVKPNSIQGPRPRCWVKNTIPLQQSNGCCVSGIKVGNPPPKMRSMERDSDRMGSDFSNFDLAAADPRLCRGECAGNSRCQAWTYVKPNTIQGPRPRCWLKNAIPRAKQDTCCVSGIKGVLFDEGPALNPEQE